jgi:putative peptide zinc metalloprotease protein
MLGEEKLPFLPLRNEIRLHPSTEQKDGSPSWTLHDPWRDQFFRVGQLEMEILSRWHLADEASICEQIRAHTTLQVDSTAVEQVKAFVIEQQLCVPQGAGTAERLSAIHDKRKKSPGVWLLHNYLFLRIPLIHPDGFLNKTYPWIRWAFSSSFFAIAGLFGLLGFYLVGRSWDVFAATFMYFFDWQGFGFFALALVFVKICHEFGHAYTAKHYGLPVSNMGIAFLVMWPVLYTDTSHAWLLTQRRKRLHIAVAGMLVEMMLAILATVVWAFAPDGVLRSAAFFIATVSWVSTLFINLNPFMRFDGYYFLADWSGIENFQHRSFEMARWKLREWLFGFGEQPPEQFTANTRCWLILYAFSTWVYRLFLFIGIALLVYFFFFKALGIILFVAEIAWFILLPIKNELQRWWQRREQLRWNRRSILTSAAMLLLCALILVPWLTRIDIPVVIRPVNYSHLHAPVAAQITQIRVTAGQRVAEGDLLFELTSPELVQQRQIVGSELRALDWQLDRHHLAQDARWNTQVLRQQKRTAQAKSRSLDERAQRLQIFAPFDGVVFDVDESLQEGSWVDAERVLGYLADVNEFIAEGYVQEKYLNRLSVHATGVVYSDMNRGSPQPINIQSIDRTQSSVLPQSYLASVYDGPIAVREQNGQLIPESSVYKVLLNLDGNELLRPRLIYRGEAHLQGERETIVYAAYRTIASVLVRESGF